MQPPPQGMPRGQIPAGVMQPMPRGYPIIQGGPPIQQMANMQLLGGPGMPPMQPIPMGQPIGGQIQMPGGPMIMAGPPPVQPGMPIPTAMMPMPFDMLEEALGPFPCVRLRGLPYQASFEDVLRFCQGLTIIDIVMVVHNDGRQTGEALVVFSNHMDFNMALSRDKQNLGRRYIEVFPAKRVEYYYGIMGQIHLQMYNQNHNQMPPVPYSNRGPPPQGNMGRPHQPYYKRRQYDHGRRRAPPEEGASPNGQSQQSPTSTDQISPKSVTHTGVIRMRGLPFNATKADILAFFQGLNVLEESVQFVFRPDGRLSGEAFVSLSSPAEAEEAMSRNGSHIGSRYVELFPSGIDEAARHTSRHQV